MSHHLRDIEVLQRIQRMVRAYHGKAITWNELIAQITELLLSTKRLDLTGSVFLLLDQDDYGPLHAWAKNVLDHCGEARIEDLEPDEPYIESSHEVFHCGVYVSIKVAAQAELARRFAKELAQSAEE